MEGGKQHCSLHVDYLLSSTSFSSCVADWCGKWFCQSFTESEVPMRPGWCKFTWDASENKLETERGNRS